MACDCCGFAPRDRVAPPIAGAHEHLAHTLRKAMGCVNMDRINKNLRDRLMVVIAHIDAIGYDGEDEWPQ